MKLYLATHTTPQNGTPGYKWIWWHSEIPEFRLNKLYSTLAKDIPINITDLTYDDTIAGVIKIDSQWACVYRMLNGGRDAVGRQGRIVLNVALFTIGDAFKIDYSQIFKTPELSTIHDLKPSVLTMDLLDSHSIISPVVCHNISIRDHDSLIKAYAGANKLPEYSIFHLHFEQKAHGLTGELVTEFIKAKQKMPISTHENSKERTFPKSPKIKQLLFAGCLLKIIIFVLGLMLGIFLNSYLTSSKSKDEELETSQKTSRTASSIEPLVSDYHKKSKNQKTTKRYTTFRQKEIEKDTSNNEETGIPMRR